jgi:hypothetical protein
MRVVEVIAAIILNHSPKSRGMISIMPWPLYYLARDPRYPLNRRLVGPWSRSGCFVEKEDRLALQGVKTQFISCLAHSLVTMLTNYPSSLIDQNQHGTSHCRIKPYSMLIDLMEQSSLKRGRVQISWLRLLNLIKYFLYLTWFSVLY